MIITLFRVSHFSNYIYSPRLLFIALECYNLANKVPYAQWGFVYMTGANSGTSYTVNCAKARELEVINIALYGTI